MRFDQKDKSGPSTPYLNRGFQLRMLVMIAALGFIIFAIRTTSNPKFWARWFPDDATETDTVQTPKPEPKPIRPTGDASPGEDDPKPALEVFESTPDAATIADAPIESELPEMKARLDTVPVEFDRERLLNVEDDTVGLVAADAEPFYFLLDHAARVPLEELHAAAHEHVSREALLTIPENYRGIPITIEGELRRSRILDAGTNIYGIDRYFDGWVIVSYSAGIPWRVCALEIESDVPLRESISEIVPVRISGYFLKVFGYESQDGLKITPLLIARKIELAPAAHVIPIEDGDYVNRWIFWGFCGLFAVAIVTIGIAMRGDRKSRSYRRETIETGGDLSEFQGEQGYDPGRDLQRMAEQSEQG